MKITIKELCEIMNCKSPHVITQYLGRGEFEKCMWHKGVIYNFQEKDMEKMRLLIEQRKDKWNR